MSPEPDLGSGETPAVRTRAVLLVTAAMLAALLIVAFGLELVFPSAIGTTHVSRQRFPSPGVNADERAERAQFEAPQRAALGGAGGRMPIEAAMRAVAAKGSRAFDPIEATR